eukprot:gene22018-26129_t
MTKPLKLAVVGHTNVGKTSLLRTLTRDVGFGEVSHRSEARQRFEQEAKVLRQLLTSDAGLYVIDAREPVLAKYRDELQVLASCGKPLLPVLNFVSSADHREPDWREALARLGLHALVRFDSVAPPEDGERRLYESLALLLENSREQLERLILDQEAQRQARQQSAARLIAELLVDCAACRRSVVSEAEVEQQAISELRKAVRQREQRCVEALLKLFGFRPQDAAASDLPLLDGRWGDDLFNPETLKQLGVRVGGGIAAGAAAGAGVDLLVGGLTLGAAALAGAIAGGALQTARSYGSRLLGKIKGQRELTVDDSVLRLLALRQRQLLKALNLRGHAAIHSIKVDTPQDKTWREGKLPEALNKARAHPQWSSLNPHPKLSQAERQEQVEALAQRLDET